MGSGERPCGRSVFEAAVEQSSRGKNGKRRGGTGCRSFGIRHGDRVIACLTRLSDNAQLAARIASPDVKGLFASAIVSGAKDAVPQKAYLEALAARPALQQLYAEMFRKHHIVALAFPTTPLPAAPIGDDEKTRLNGADVPTFATFIQNTDPGSNAGIPGLSLPIGRTPAGLPVGLELDGPAGSDRRLLGVGLALESLFGRLPAP